MDSVTGKLVTPLGDRLADEHFNCMLDAIGQWKRNTKSGDCSLLSKISLKFLKKICFFRSINEP